MHITSLIIVNMLLCNMLLIPPVSLQGSVVIDGVYWLSQQSLIWIADGPFSQVLPPLVWLEPIAYPIIHSVIIFRHYLL